MHIYPSTTESKYLSSCVLYNQPDATYTIFLIIISALHVSVGFSTHHQELIKLYVQPWALSCFPAVYRWCGWVGTSFHWTQCTLWFSVMDLCSFKLYPPNDIYIYICRTAPLTSRCCILYIYSTNIRTEYFKTCCTLSSSKCRLFHNATFFGSCIIHILNTECAKI